MCGHTQVFENGFNVGNLQKTPESFTTAFMIVQAFTEWFKDENNVLVIPFVLDFASVILSEKSEGWFQICITYTHALR